MACQARNEYTHTLKCFNTNEAIIINITHAARTHTHALDALRVAVLEIANTFCGIGRSVVFW